MTADQPAAGTDQAIEARLLAAYEASKASDDGRSLPSPDRFLLRVLRERDEAQAEAATLRADLDAAQAKVERVEALRDRLRGADHHSGLNYHHGTRYADWLTSALDGTSGQVVTDLFPPDVQRNLDDPRNSPRACGQERGDDHG